MSEIWEGLFILFILMSSTVSFFSPLIISLATKNWWFLFLFAVSWIPAIALLAVTKVIIKD